MFFVFLLCYTGIVLCFCLQCYCFTQGHCYVLMCIFIMLHSGSFWFCICITVCRDIIMGLCVCTTSIVLHGRCCVPMCICIMLHRAGINGYIFILYYTGAALLCFYVCFIVG